MSEDLRAALRQSIREKQARGEHVGMLKNCKCADCGKRRRTFITVLPEVDPDAPVIDAEILEE